MTTGTGGTRSLWRRFRAFLGRWLVPNGDVLHKMAGHEVLGPLTPLPLAPTDDVWLYVTDGPPVSTSGIGATRYSDQVTIYENTGTAEVPVWSVLPTAAINNGPDEPVTPSTGTDDWYVQNYLAGTNFVGLSQTLWQGDGAAGWASGGAVDNQLVQSLEPPTDAADATGAGVAGLGSMCVDRTTPGRGGWYENTGSVAAPEWTPLVAFFDGSVVHPGALRLVNYAFPPGTTYAQARTAFVGTSGADTGWIVGLPTNNAVRTAALFAHVLPAPAMAAGIRLTWNEVTYKFYADKPEADPDTGVITYAELGNGDTSLENAIVQLLVQGWVP